MGRIIEKSAGAIVFYMDSVDKREYLLLHYPSGHWDFPKGNIEFGEDPLQTAYREVMEETGLSRDVLILIQGFEKTIKYYFMSHGNIVYKTVIFYLMRSLSKDVKLSWEHKGYRWLSFPEAYNLATFKTAKNLLRDAEQYIRKLIKDGLLKP
ncbi:diadenosine tetraphosphate hydrolase [Candidatus Geothermarchaeota archaeon]|nr:MAG: diadenosine tetraphosphate hydrolase [Candidatus Geothermarchaeota archaeon]HEW93761.1 NUDIX domain-containing protein [Thermoprotei archaeon]